MRALFCLLLAAGVAFSQGHGKKPVFEFPDEKPDQPEARKENGADDALERTLKRLAGWPQERARRAAERLIVQKEKSLARVLDLLVSAEPEAAPLKPGAAYVLGRIGDRSHYMMLLHVAVEKEQQRHAGVFLEAAWRLASDEAVAEAFRFFHLSETRLRREAVKFVLDRVGPKNLPAILELLDRRKAERSFTREIGLRLLDRLVETRKVEWGQVAERFYRALGDESPQVASRAMRLLASRNEPDNVRRLNELIAGPRSYWRQRSYAALALALLASAFKEQPISPEALQVLRGERGLRHPKETLARASAALALAQVALRTNDRELVRLLDREIPIVLIDAVGARRHHYRDFGSVMPLAYAMLRRITAQNLPDRAPDWADWWRDHGRSFRARRELTEVDPRDYPEVVVEFTWPRDDGGARVRLTVVGDNRPTFLHGRAYALPQEDIEGLLALLRETGFFASPEFGAEQLEPDAALAVVRMGDLDRTVAYPAGEERKAVRDRLLERVRTLCDAYAWQRWWDRRRQPSWNLFFAENRRWFASHTDPAERAARLRRMVAGALPGLVTVEDRAGAARFVAGLPGGGGALDDGEVAAFLEAVSAEREANAFVTQTIELLVPAAGRRASGGLVDALAAQVGPAAQDLLVRVCDSLDDAYVATLAADKRWKVRRAAVVSLAGREGPAVREVLRHTLADSEVAVRMAAAESLARRHDPACLAVLAAGARHRQPGVRERAAFAYGLLGGDRGLSGVRPLLFEDRNPSVRERAIRGLVEGGDPGAARLLLDVFAAETDVRVRAAAASGLVELETPELVEELLQRLELTRSQDPERVALVNVLARFASDRPVEMLRRVLQGDDPASADAAALGLARRWDEAALTQLVQMLRRGSNALIALRHLQLLASRAFEVETYEEQAKNYAAWWKTHSIGQPRRWFTDALTERGYETVAFSAWADAPAGKAPPVTDAMVPVLLKALRDEDWYVRRNAAFVLARRIGKGAPEVIDYRTPPARAEQAIRAFHAWWFEVEAERKATEQG